MMTANVKKLRCVWVAAISIIALIFGAPLALGQGPASATTDRQRVEFIRDVLPILRERCHKCHGGVHREADLSLLAPDSAFAALPSGARAIVPNDPESSELVRRVTATSEDERMPPTGDRLTDAEVEVLRRWIAGGAKWEKHWSYRPLQRPVPPHSAAMSTWASSTIDQFVFERLTAAALSPSPEAERYSLIRRLYLDLTGLPPTIDQIDAYCNSERPDAYEQLVDYLLASPNFGERWGRHWLDQARYADTDGFEVDGPRPTAWLWRDWVIDALNADMPFDQFTVEQIAGDLIPGATPRQQLATGFHRQSLTNKEGGIDKGEARFRELVERVNAVGTIWFGTTVACAQCHDHPYDPLTQREFYQLYAFFNQSDDAELTVQETGSTSSRRTVSSGRNESKSLAAQVVTQAKELRATKVYHRGDYLRPGGAVSPELFSALHRPATTRPEQSRMLDRLDLARWIVHPDNFLTPRVAANQLWIRLFGAGLVRTPDDFGTHGRPPVDPELLDWLAVEYVGRGWSTKQMIRQIVTSAAYRQSSKHRPEAQTTDPLNERWHRQNRFRVEAELVHDLSLSAAGLLTAKIGGPSFYPPLPDEVTKLSFRSNYVWKASVGSERYRRGMYIFYKRTLPHPNLDTFDCPDATAALLQRENSNNPLQALVTLNNEMFSEAARALAIQVLATSSSSDHERIEYLFRRCLGRAPIDSDRKAVIDFLDQSRRWYQVNKADANAMIGQLAPSVADASEAAAWVAVCNIVLNMDEFLTRE
jgi:hypothetical protein